MRYLLLIYSDEAESVYNKTGEEAEALMARWFEYTTEMQQAGKMLGGDALHLSNTAKTVRLSDGEAITTDGPFAETKEQLGGYYMVDAESEAEALAWAAKMPNLPGGGAVEVRPLMEFDDPNSM
jgi:hypothetical protein